MTFKQKSSTQIINSDKKKIEEEITSLGLYLENMQKEADSLKSLTLEIAIAKNELATIKSEQEQLDKLIRDEVISLKTIKDEQEKVKREISDNEELRNSLEVESVELGGKINDIVKEKDKREKELKSLQDQIQPIEKRIADLLSDEKKEKERIKKETETLYSEITDLKEEKNSLEEIIKGLEQSITFDKVLIETDNKKINELSDTKKSIENDIKKKSDEFHELHITQIKQLGEKQLEMDNREGELSVKESWINEKSEQLRNAKNELEKYFNKKIDLNL